MAKTDKYSPQVYAIKSWSLHFFHYEIFKDYRCEFNSLIFLQTQVFTTESTNKTANLKIAACVCAVLALVELSSPFLLLINI